MTNRLITVAELAERWHCSRAHVYNLLGRGLPSKSIGRCRRFDQDEADAWLEEQTVRGAA